MDADRFSLSQEYACALLTIDLDAICANWRLLGERVRPGACGAVVKANAYGLGAAPVARALYRAGCREFFVAQVEEGVHLRSVLPSSALVYVLQGCLPGGEQACLEHDLIPVLNSLDQVERWQSLARRRQRVLDAALQFDTGMARLGLSPADADRLEAEPERLHSLRISLVLSHLVAAEVAEDPVNLLQLERFRMLRAKWPHGRASLANSSGIFLDQAFHFDLARPGAALYGVAPKPGVNPLRPVVRLQGRLIQWREIEAGTGVGYNHTWRATRRARIATVAVGYADGYLRSASNRARLRFQGTEVPLIGRVSMDTVTVDASDIPAAALTPGALFDVLDSAQDINALAAQAGTNAYEILTSLGDRFQRRYLSKPQLSDI
ncbi:MAG TPA: alanine racemase [Burkholderiaceae bacterium]|nr:alanine racemase [Burkholderiaceae bacterium]